MPKQRRQQTGPLNVDDLGRKFCAALHCELTGAKSVDNVARTFPKVNCSWENFTEILLTDGIKESGILIGPEHPWYNAGRRAYAVIIAAKMGLSRVDYALKTYTPTRIDRSWPEMAAAAFDCLHNPLADLTQTFRGRGGDLYIGAPGHSHPCFHPAVGLLCRKFRPFR